MGMIDRHGPYKDTEWVAAVKEELAKPAPLCLEGTAVLADNAIAITVKAEGTDGIVMGKLQVWLLEDSITALQLMPNGKVNQQYVHNHVFRTAVNGTWGEDFSVEEGMSEQRTMSLPLQPAWKKENLSIVAFVYNNDGVQQATKFIIED